MTRTASAGAGGEPALEAGDSPLAIFEHEDGERLEPEVLERVFAALLAIHPDAPVGAHTAAGVMVPMPDSISLKENPVQEARSGLDLIVFDERVLQGWERALSRGAAQYGVTPVGYPDAEGIVYAIDLRERHGVIVTIAVFESSEAIEAIVDEVPDPLPRFATLWKDTQGVIIKAGDATARMLGYGEEELVGHRSLEFIHPEDHALAVDNWVQMLAVPGPARRIRLRHLRHDGSWMWLELTNHNLLHDPDYECMVSEMVDISEEMAAHELVDRLANAVPVGLLQVDPDRRIAYSNDRLHEILGVERGGDFDALLVCVADEDRVTLEQALAASIESGRHAEVEVEVQLPGTGELRRCSIGIRPLTHEGGELTGAIACVADITESARMRDELQRRATFDELTGCYNRAAVIRLLEEHVASGRRASERAVMFADVDGFKSVNDRYGHAAGDEVLRAVAGRLRDAVRDQDMIGRMGGDEFLIVCPDVGGAENAAAMLQRLVDGATVTIPDCETEVGISVGAAWSRGEELDAESLVARADRAMYEAKRGKAGR
jgi:diguanylate cyclase (GGDEF)-like protein/PAS domain S-box-containing protein